MTTQEKHKFCSKCILPDGFIGIELDSQGACNFCRDPSYENQNYSKRVIPNVLKKEKLGDWKSTIKVLKESQSEGEYDCLLGYSGGKDSTALLDTLLNEYGLRPFLITIDTGLMTDVAKDNIRQTLKKLEYEDHHLFINYAIPTFLKLYNYLFIHHDSEEELLTKRVCDRCSDLLHSVMVKEALKRDLNLCILGYSPDQIRRYFYEIPKHEIRDEWTPKFLEDPFFDDHDQDCYVYQEDFEGKAIPRILLPYHVLDYNEEELVKNIVEKGLIERGKTSPVLTNCHTVKAAIVFDYRQYGWISYSLQYAELIRQTQDESERKKARKKWLRLCKIIETQIQKGIFNKRGIDTFLEKTDLKKELLFS
jgi:3'-phosphoadenosine 5'-phosphosulfate sulfotransferase (PAPS reductase)/FAD synthetase